MRERERERERERGKESRVHGFDWRVYVSGWRDEEMCGSGVLIYKTVSDRLVTREQPREMGFMGRIAFTGSKFVYLWFF